MKINKTRIFSSLTMSLFLAASVWSQSGGSFAITQSIIAGGGGQNVNGGMFTIDYTIAQPVAGSAADGSPYSVTPGFWPEASATATPTPSPTATPTPAPMISGTVTYGNALSGPSPRFVSHVLISGGGSPDVSTFSDFPGGNYSLTGFGAGAYSVTPSKTGGVNSITSFDAAKVAQHVSGVNLLTGNQLIVADVSNNGSISSFDAGLIAKYVTSSPPYGIAGTWRFSPAARNYASVGTSIAGDDYVALLMGEVSGNWTNTGARPAIGPERSTTVSLPQLVTPAGNEVLIAVGIQGAADKGIIAYEFDLRYDPTVLEPQPNPIDLAGTASSRLLFSVNAEEAGLLKVAVYGATPIDSSGVLLNLRFNAVGAPGSVSKLTWERILLNEGDPGTTATAGQVMLSAAGSNHAAISGRLLDPFGAAIPNSRVTLTSTTGQSRTTLSNGFGVYRFEGLQVGQTYTISVDSRNHSFAPITVSIIEQLVNLDVIAER